MTIWEMWQKVKGQQSAAPGPVLRGRISRISVIKGGEVSVVVRFGIEETRARNLVPGTLIEIVADERLEQS